MAIKERMKSLGVSQVEIIKALQKRGINVNPPMMSNILQGVYTHPKAEKVLQEIEEILNDFERNVDN